MKIKLFVSHRVDQKSKIICNEVIVPVYCGAVYKDDEWQDGVVGDNTGDNISYKRMSFCELTVQYWAWKNIKVDYYGLCHYRRYLSFGSKDGFRNEQNQIYLPCLNENSIRKYAFKDVDAIEDLCSRYDAILPEAADVRRITPLGKRPKNVLELWKAHEGMFFAKETLELLLQAVKKIQPQYYEIAIEYLYSEKHRGYNCYLMNKKIFDKLCNLQFSVMEEIEKDISKDVLQQYPRTIGYMGEILFGVFQYSLIQKKENILEVPLVLFERANDDINKVNLLRVFCNYYSKRFIIKYFPNWGIRITKEIYHKILC